MTTARVHDLRTAADLSYEPEDGLRRELHDGVVYVAPPPSNIHGREVRAADHALSAHAPADVLIFQNVGVHVGLRRLYIPDVLAVHVGTPFHDNGYDPGGVVLVVEAVSPSSITLDRVTKPAIYAEMGIPYFWRIDSLGGRGPRLEAFRLDPTTSQYVLEAELGPGDIGTIKHPWAVSVDMADFILPGGA
jgi:Uma2 family endonuclease